MTTPDETAAELTAEARGEAPGRGRRILVVGAGSARFQGESDPPGNGQAIARLAAREGAEVICADLDLVTAGRTVEAIVGEGGVAMALQGDVWLRFGDPARAPDRPPACQFHPWEYRLLCGDGGSAGAS